MGNGAEFVILITYTIKQMHKLSVVNLDTTHMVIVTKPFLILFLKHYPAGMKEMLKGSPNPIQTLFSAILIVGMQAEQGIGPNCPGISGTVTDFFGPSRIPDSFIIVPEVEERRTIRPLVV